MPRLAELLGEELVGKLKRSLNLGAFVPPPGSDENEQSTSWTPASTEEDEEETPVCGRSRYGPRRITGSPVGSSG